MFAYSVLFGLIWALCDGQACDKGFVEYGNSCYIVIPEIAPWLISMEYCKAFHMSLADVQSLGEYNFLKDYLYTNRGKLTRAADIWTAGTHMLPAEWTWAGTLEQVTAFYWGPGEPNNMLSYEHCLSFYHRKNFTWNDERCSVNGYPLCEKPLVTGTNPGVGLQPLQS